MWRQISTLIAAIGLCATSIFAEVQAPNKAQLRDMAVLSNFVTAMNQAGLHSEVNTSLNFILNAGYPGTPGMKPALDKAREAYGLPRSQFHGPMSRLFADSSYGGVFLGTAIIKNNLGLAAFGFDVFRRDHRKFSPNHYLFAARLATKATNKEGFVNEEMGFEWGLWSVPLPGNFIRVIPLVAVLSRTKTVLENRHPKSEGKIKFSPGLRIDWGGFYFQATPWSDLAPVSGGVLIFRQ